MKSEERTGWRNPKDRFRHTWIVAPTGAGKTTLLKALIAYDLKAVAKDNASLIIIEGEGQVLPIIQSLKLFDTVVLDVLDPNDLNLSLNPFDVSASDRSQLSTVIELLTFVMGSLLDAPMTAKQAGFFDYLVATMLNTEGATVAMMIGVLKGTIPIDLTHVTDPDTLHFWQNTFKRDETRDQISWRLDRILRGNEAMRRIFSNQKNDADYAFLMSTPGVTVIHPNRRVLGTTGAAFFGRLALAQILRAAETTRDPNGTDIPCFVYIDEAQSYIANDPHVPEMLDRLRKYNVGLIFANHRTDQLSTSVESALLQASGTIIASQVEHTTAATLSKVMRCEPEDFILPTGNFMMRIRGQIDHAKKMRVEPNELESWPRRYQVALPASQAPPAPQIEYLPPEQPQQGLTREDVVGIVRETIQGTMQVMAEVIKVAVVEGIKEGVRQASQPQQLAEPPQPANQNTATFRKYKRKKGGEKRRSEEEFTPKT